MKNLKFTKRFEEIKEGKLIAIKEVKEGNYFKTYNDHYGANAFIYQLVKISARNFNGMKSKCKLIGELKNGKYTFIETLSTDFCFIGDNKWVEKV